MLLAGVSTPSLSLNFQTGSLDPRVTFTRASSATYFDSTGTLQTASTNVPRFDYGPKPVVTNYITNNTMQGAVAGSPGTAPTGWVINAGSGVTASIVGIGTESDIPYIDVAYSGTTNALTNLSVSFNNTNINGAPCSNGQTWTLSGYSRLISGSFGSTNLPPAWGLNEYTSGGTFLTNGRGTFTATGSPLASQRGSYTRILSGGSTTAFITPSWNIQYNTGVTVSFTIRIGLPQLEFASSASSTIVRTTGTVASNQYINWIPNSSASGGAAGVLPTGWTINGSSTATQTSSGITISVIGLVTATDGKPALRINLAGTSSGASVHNIGMTSGSNNLKFRLYPGIKYTQSVYMATVSGTWTGSGTSITMWGQNKDLSGNVVTDLQPAQTVTSTWTRFTSTQTPATAADYQLGYSILFYFGSGQTFNYTIDIGAPQWELMPQASAWIPTSTAPDTLGAVPLGLLMEPQSTNAIRNNTMAGAAVGSPGTQPTNWASWALWTVAGLGTESGINFIDEAINNGSAQVGAFSAFDATTAQAASPGQIWTASAYFRLMSGTLTNLTDIEITVRYYDSGAAFISQQFTTFTPTTNPLATQRVSQTFTAPANTAFVNTGLRFNSSGAVNFTLRIGMPQLEKFSFTGGATAVIPTSGSTATRAFDVANITGTYVNPSAGTLIGSGSINFIQGSSQDLFSLSAITNNGNDAIICRETLSGGILAQIFVGNSSTGVDSTLGSNITGSFKAGFTFRSQNVRTAVNGSVTTGLNANTPEIHVINLSSTRALQPAWYVKSLKYWTRQLNTTELIQATR
jgi:hypothetical protein